VLIGKGFQEVNTQSTATKLTPLEIKSNNIRLISEEKIDFNITDEKITFNGVEIDKTKLIYPNVELNIEASEDNKFYLVKKANARGKSSKEALLRAEQIVTTTRVVDSSLFVSRMLDVNSAPPFFRFQKVKYTLKMPIGSTIYLDKSSKDLIYDIKNIGDIFDGDMIGHTWKMTVNGLKCQDCTGDEKTNEDWEEEESSKDDSEEDIDMKGLNINIDDDGENIVRMNDSVIYIKGKDKETIIDLKKRKKTENSKL
jgi:hypothetical protein